MYQITLSQAQLEALVGMIDLALKTHGVKIIKQTDALLDRIAEAQLLPPAEPTT